MNEIQRQYESLSISRRDNKAQDHFEHVYQRFIETTPQESRIDELFFARLFKQSLKKCRPQVPNTEIDILKRLGERVEQVQCKHNYYTPLNFPEIILNVDRLIATIYWIIQKGSDEMPTHFLESASDSWFYRVQMNSNPGSDVTGFLGEPIINLRLLVQELYDILPPLNSDKEVSAIHDTNDTFYLPTTCIDLLSSICKRLRCAIEENSVKNKCGSGLGIIHPPNQSEEWCFYGKVKIPI